MDGLKQTGYVGGVSAVKKTRTVEARKKQKQSENKQHKENKSKQAPDEEHVVDEYV